MLGSTPSSKRAKIKVAHCHTMRPIAAVMSNPTIGSTIG
jgi:hypothetical protein